MKKTTFSLLLMFFAMMNISAQFDIMDISNFVFVGTPYGSGDVAALFNDPFVYSPNTPKATLPLVAWDGGNSHCVLKDASPYGANYIGFDATPKADTRIYAIDLWGRENGMEKDRSNYLYIEISNGLDTWKSGELYDLYDSGAEAYARIVFSDLPESLLSGTVSVKITRKSGTWLDLYEARMVAIEIVELPTPGVSMTNPSYGEGWVDAKAGDGGQALNAINDVFTYNPLVPTLSKPSQEWVPAEQCFVKNATGATDTITWECDYEVEVGKVLYAVDVWGRTPAQTGNDAGRTKDLIFSLMSTDGTVKWQSTGFWNGVPEDNSSYGRYVFSSAVPQDLLTGAGHFVLGKRAYDTKFFHLAELRMVAIDLPNNAPMANAGEDQEVVQGVSVTLNGSASSDNDGDSIRYSWVSITYAGIALSSVTDSMPVFTAPSVNGVYKFELTASDGEDTDVDTVSITVSTATGFEREIASQLNVYPNPSTNGFFVALAPGDVLGQVQVYDIGGVAVINRMENSNICRIRHSELGRGVYFVKLSNYKPIKLIVQ